MNFFAQQDHARRQTRLLIILFILAVIAIVIAVNAAMALLWTWTQGGYASGPEFYPKGFFATNTLVTLALIAAGTLIETYNLRDGGDAVAKMAGGRAVSPASQDLGERRLLNVVEEMAIASGIACPKVYLLDKEESINAFAAGYNRNEAVIAVTRGTLDRLTRDELQGVVAHEFSHILNGDMRLNIRLIGVLFGIQMIAGFGQHLMDFGWRVWRTSSSHDKGRSGRLILLVVGFVLYVIGYIGIFFGRLIKSAVSRQREFLADASAVQFTRNADGIGNALRKIGGLSRTLGLGSHVAHPNAEQLSHLFLGAPRKSLVDGLFATHPPLRERLRRIYGRSVEPLDAPALADDDASRAAMLPDIPYLVANSADHRTQAASFAGPAATDNDVDRQIPLPPELDSAMREPDAACGIVYALLLGNETERDAQLEVLKSELPQQLPFVVFLATALRKLPKSARLPLLDLATPALRQLPPERRARLIIIADKLVAADRRLTLAEFVVQTVLSRRLDAHAGRAIPAKYAGIAALKAHCITLLSLVAHASASECQQAAPDIFLRGAAHCQELGLSRKDLKERKAIGFVPVKIALDHASQLAPLGKPRLIKMLVAAAEHNGTLSVAAADLLRALCAAIDAPVPPAVAKTYTAYHW